MPEPLGGHPADGGPRAGGARHLVHGMERLGGLAQDVVRTAAGRRDAGHEEQPRRPGVGAGALLALERAHLRRWTRADRGRGGDAVVRLSPEVVLHVGRGVIHGPPGRVALVAEVHVHVDHRRHHGAAGEVDPPGPGGHRDGAGLAHRPNPSAFDQDGAALHGGAGVPRNQTGALEHDGGPGPLGQGQRRQGKRGQRQPDEPAKQPSRHRIPPFIPVAGCGGMLPEAARP